MTQHSEGEGVKVVDRRALLQVKSIAKQYAHTVVCVEVNSYLRSKLEYDNRKNSQLAGR